jgi:hypothetical protein
MKELQKNLKKLQVNKCLHLIFNKIFNKNLYINVQFVET